MQHLIIRADSTPSMGTGHIMRCIALAQGWQDRGGKVTFISHCETKLLRERLQDEGFNLVSVKASHPDPSDLQLTLDFLHNLKASSQERPIVVTDGYHFDTAYQKAIKESGYRLMVIDDYNHLAHYQADILLNQNINALELKYSCNENTMQLLGCKYVMLRREFLLYRDFKREIPDKARNILVTMGGADPNNVTLKVLKAIYLLDDQDIKVKVIIGPSNPNLEILKSEITGSDLPISLICSPPPEKMLELMSWADLAITAGGSTCWELAFMGVPSLIITVAENQEGIGSGLERAGAAILLGWHKNVQRTILLNDIKQLIKNKQKREELSIKAREVVDGKGVKRILRQLIIGDIIIRKATMQDSKFLWCLANDAIVRKASFHSDYITWETHCNWFNKKMSDPNSYLFIATDRNNLPIGQIRFDLSNDIAEVSYSVCQMARGFGLGKLIIEKGIKLLHKFVKGPLLLQAKIKMSNKASIKTVQRVGFRLKEIVSDNSSQINIYQLNLSKNMETL